MAGPVTSATITADANNSGLVCQDQDFVASYLPANATLPVTYTWDPEPNAGQGTDTATYNTVRSCYTITLTVTNALGSAADTLDVVLTLHLSQIAEAIQDTLETNMSATLLTRVYGWDELPEGIQDTPSLAVYWQQVTNDAQTSTDRTTFSKVRVKELIFHIDYFASARNQLAEDNERLTNAASQIIDILETEAAAACATGASHCPPFGLCALKTFRWWGERVVYDYGGILLYGARFYITLLVY
jgi:hypothetical protein